MVGWWKLALAGPDGVAPSRMVGVSASVNLPLHHKVQKFYSGTGSPGWSRKKGRKTVMAAVVVLLLYVNYMTWHRYLCAQCKSLCAVVLLVNERNDHFKSKISFVEDGAQHPPQVYP